MRQLSHVGLSTRFRPHLFVLVFSLLLVLNTSQYQLFAVLLSEGYRRQMTAGHRARWPWARGGEQPEQPEQQQEEQGWHQVRNERVAAAPLAFDWAASGRGLERN